MHERTNDPDHVEDPRIAELLRVNAELAAEVRSLSLGRRSAPRVGAVPVSRHLVSLDATRARLEAAEVELAEMQTQRDALLAHKAAQEREIALLRGGASGLFRRLQARLRRR
jgi:hypothetical protein